jgi:hypothetical protein
VLYDAGTFSVGKLFDMEKEAIYNLKKPIKKISRNFLLLLLKRNRLPEKFSAMKTLPII